MNKERERERESERQRERARERHKYYVDLLLLLSFYLNCCSESSWVGDSFLSDSKKRTFEKMITSFETKNKSSREFLRRLVKSRSKN